MPTDYHNIQNNSADGQWTGAHLLAHSSLGQLPLSSTRIIFLVLQFFHVLIFALLLDGSVDPFLLGLSGIVSLILYTYFLIKELKLASDGVTPFIFYIAASIFRIGLGTIYVTSVYTTGDSWALTVGMDNTSDWLMEGHLIVMTGDWFFIAGYLFIETNYRRAIHSPKTNYNSLFKKAYLAGSITVIIALASRLAFEIGGMGGLGMAIGYIADYGMPAGTYLMLISVHKRERGWLNVRGIVAISILLLNIVFSFSSYMKSDLFIAAFPAILLGIDVARQKWHYRGLRKTWKPALLVTLIVYFFLFVVSSYSELRRPAFWINNANQVIPGLDGTTPEVSSFLKIALKGSLPGTEEFSELHKYPRNGVWGILSRMTVDQLGAWAYQSVDRAGTKEGSFIDGVLITITPRILWPDKPILSPGRDFAVEVGIAGSAETATTALALTMQGSYYWWGGIFGLIAGTFISGFGFGLVWVLVKEERHVNPVAALVTMLLLYSAFHWFESAFYGAFPLYLYILIVFVPLMIGISYLMGIRGVGSGGILATQNKIN